MSVQSFFDDSVNSVQQWLNADSEQVINNSHIAWLLLAVLVIGLIAIVLSIGNNRQMKRLKSSSLGDIEIAKDADSEQQVDWQSGFVQTLHVEAKIDFLYYQDTLAAKIENIASRKAHYEYSAQYSKLFSFYHLNLMTVTGLSNDALRLQIVKANTLFARLANTIEHNNKLYTVFLSLQELAQRTERPIDESKLQAHVLLMQKHGQIMLNAHNLMMPQLRQMLSMLSSARKED
jgi:hypothetical protein